MKKYVPAKVEVISVNPTEVFAQSSGGLPCVRVFDLDWNDNRCHETQDCNRDVSYAYGGSSNCILNQDVFVD